MFHDRVRGEYRAADHGIDNPLTGHQPLLNTEQAFGLVDCMQDGAAQLPAQLAPPAFGSFAQGACCEWSLLLTTHQRTQRVFVLTRIPKLPPIFQLAAV